MKVQWSFANNGSFSWGFNIESTVGVAMLIRWNLICCGRECVLAFKSMVPWFKVIQESKNTEMEILASMLIIIAEHFWEVIETNTSFSQNILSVISYLISLKYTISKFIHNLTKSNITFIYFCYLKLLELFMLLLILYVQVELILN